ncbi:MAG: hypothetical protein ACJ8IR_09275 [Alphaproteobacteria bacterium]|jgi:hypothetical protein
MNENKGSSGKVTGDPPPAAETEGGPNASGKRPTHSAPPNRDGRKGNKHAGHDNDSGQFSQSGSRDR